MTIRQQLAISIARLSQRVLKRLTNGGSSFPGQLAQKIDPTVFQAITADYDVVMITGTNGKTLTTALTVEALRDQYDHILTNPTGANMLQGIVSTFLADRAPKGARKIAVLEIDEATLNKVTAVIKPKAIVFTNLFRDQMDRYGEIYSVYQMMLDGAKNAPVATIIANGDSPIFNANRLDNPYQFFGFNHLPPQEDVALDPNTDGVLCPICHHLLHYYLNTYSNLGDYYCRTGDFKRPALDYAVTSVDTLTINQSDFAIDGHTFQLNIGGMYNIYNALAAYSLARFLGASPESIKAGFNRAKRIFGRQEAIHIDDKNVLINLTKNPVGVNQVIDLLTNEPDPYTLVCLLNNNYADGQDVSWIWDGHYEIFKEKGIQRVLYGGMKADEMKKRLLVAGFDESQLVYVSDLTQLPAAISAVDTKQVHVLATYTAMLDLRKTLIQQGFIKE
ncbi:Mur ligase family protein [Atopobacter phocae]|uniref:Mur ligase family protein n=1 Tax=Atopobacter phocae TaxID=136492 RepID=UPI00046EF815|nr:Mur ligase family protein [Atopobacter phocae]